jgi:hypothetical protein
MEVILWAELIANGFYLCWPTTFEKLHLIAVTDVASGVIKMHYSFENA